MDENSRHIDFEILVGKYLAGEASPHEIEVLENWVKTSEENKKLFREQKRVWMLAAGKTASFKSTEAFSQLEKTLFADEKEIPAIKPPAKKLALSPVWRVAAAVTVLVSIGLLIYFMVKTPQTELVAHAGILTEKLTDGSEVTLNQQSKLTFANDFGKNERRVSLQGDAYFDVAKNPEKPFIIETDGLDIKVLGTSFYVDAGATSDIVEVIVQSGTVELHSYGGGEVTLEAGEKGIYAKGSGNLQKVVSGDQNFLSWKTKIMKFEDADLTTVATVIAKTYRVKIEIENPQLRECRLTATFDNQSLDDVLMIIEQTLDIEISRSGESVTFLGNGCL
ncbi:MAG: FecR domain-containing protein [Bacteroidales bacterium]|nr:FecR domain-containing protein [Bacteroidales bacterium]